MLDPMNSLTKSSRMDASVSAGEVCGSPCSDSSIQTVGLFRGSIPPPFISWAMVCSRCRSSFSVTDADMSNISMALDRYMRELASYCKHELL